VNIWDALSGQPMRQMRHIPVKGNRVQSPTLSPDGEWLSLIVDDKAALWNVATGKLVYELPYGQVINQIAFSPDASELIVWIWHSAQVQLEVRDRWTGRVKQVPQEDIAVILAGCQSVCTSMNPSGIEGIKVPENISRLTCSSISADGRLVACYSAKTVRLFNFVTGEELGWFTPLDNGEYIGGSPKLGLIASAGAETQVQLAIGKRSWTLADVPAFKKFFHPEGINLLAPQPDRPESELAPGP
jgi:WD40 repeat protein